MLTLFGAIPDAARVVRDGNIITGGGVTAGIDFALVVAAELAGEAFAQGLQLGLEYAPAPPFNSGRPETAPPEVLAAVRAHMEADAGAAGASEGRGGGCLGVRHQIPAQPRSAESRDLTGGGADAG